MLIDLSPSPNFRRKNEQVEVVIRNEKLFKSTKVSNVEEERPL